MTPKRVEASDAPRKTGRPSKYTDALAMRICVRVAQGEPLTVVCKDPAMPHLATVYRWLEGLNSAGERTMLGTGFGERYARAKRDCAETLAGEIIAIADDTRGDYVEVTRKDGTVELVVNPDNVQRARLRVDARKWYSSKLDAKRYGDRVRQELTGADGGAIKSETTIVDDIQARLDALRERMRALALPETKGE